MHKLDQKGSLLIPLIVAVMFLFAAIGFGAWAFAGRQDYKNNVDAKIAEAVASTKQTTAIEKDAEFAEREKSPYKTYEGPATFGTLGITYPKTWSAYVDESGKSTAAVSGYMHPGFVPAINSDISFALRFEVVNTAYDTVVKGFESKVKNGTIKLSAYRAPKEPSELGSRLEGEIEAKKQGVLVLLPLRDKTIKLWTEGDAFRTDFATILESFSYVP